LEKEQAAPTWKKTFGFHPMTAWADHGPDGSGEPLALVLRPGNAGSNTAADHKEATRLALAQLPRHLRRTVLVRADTAGGTHEFLEWLTARSRRLPYSVGLTITEDIQDAIFKVPASAWTQAYYGDGEARDGAWVAEITGMLDLSSWPAGMRVIVRKERPHPGAQLRFTDIDGHRFTCLATSTKGGQLPDLELRHRRRARCEDRMVLRGSALAPMVTVSRLRSSEADIGTLSGATGVVQGRHAACQLRRAVALSWLMSSRFAARAAARSWSRSSSWRLRSMACCSRCVSLWLRASMSAGAPSPDSRHSLFAECFGQAAFELLDPGGEAEGAFLCGEQVGLQ
jgi:hypothetical protein